MPTEACPEIQENKAKVISKMTIPIKTCVRLYWVVGTVIHNLIVYEKYLFVTFLKKLT